MNECPPNPAAVDAVIMRDPCADCGSASFGYVTAGDVGGHLVTAITEYHEDGCGVLKDGAFAILTLPHSAVRLAGEMTEGLLGSVKTISEE